MRQRDPWNSSRVLHPWWSQTRKRLVVVVVVDGCLQMRMLTSLPHCCRRTEVHHDHSTSDDDVDSQMTLERQRPSLLSLAAKATMTTVQTTESSSMTMCP